MLNTPFSTWPSYTDQEAESVARVLLSNRVNYWTGSECRDFEREYAAWTGCANAVTLMNGTVALDAALDALGVGPGDEVVVSPRTFIASVSCVVNAGATPVFAEVDRDSQNVTAESVSAVMSRRTRAIVPVHLAGWPCDMEAIMALAEENNIAVIEDCAQAHGALFRGQSVGSFGDVGAWSFCQDKIITTGGEGGMITTNNRELWSRIWSSKDHGKAYEAVYERSYEPGFRWLHESIGTNWRMTEMQAAIGRIQLGRIAEWHQRRAQHAARLAKAFASCPGLRVPQPPPHVEHAWYKFYAFVRPDALRAGWNRDRVLAEIEAKGVPCYTGTCSEVYLEKAFDGIDFQPGNPLTVARELGATSLMFLVHPTLTDEEIHKTAEVVVATIAAATR